MLLPRAGLLAALLLSTAPARGDEAAARTLDLVRRAYANARLAERALVRVEQGDGSADHAEVLLGLDLRPSARVNLDLTLGPIRAWAGPGIVEARMAVTHTADVERYVGVGAWPLSWSMLLDFLPALPLPQLALALGAPAEGDADVLDLSPLAPPVRLDEVARTDDSVTLAGRDGAASVTLVIDASTWRLRSMDATVPAATGWDTLGVAFEPLPAPGDDCVATPGGLLCPPVLTARRRVQAISELRPRGLVLVPGADLAWLPLTSPAGTPALLGECLEVDAPVLIAAVPVDVDNPWMERVGKLIALAPDLPDARRMVVLFDPSATPNTTRPPAEAALRERLGPDLFIAWVDARAIPLAQALPPMQAGAIVVGPDGLVRAVASVEQVEEGSPAVGAVREALAAPSPPPAPVR